MFPRNMRAFKMEHAAHLKEHRHALGPKILHFRIETLSACKAHS